MVASDETAMPPNPLDFETTVRKELSTLYRVAQRLTGKAAEAEDLVGATLLSAAKAWNNFDGRHPKAWLIAILRNERNRTIRTAASRPQTADIEAGDLSDGDGGWKDVDLKIIGDHILAALDKIPEEYRLAVALCDVEQLTYEEAAEVLGVPAGTIRSRLHRGRHALRNRLSHLALEI